jgi:hypothetical protein
MAGQVEDRIAPPVFSSPFPVIATSPKTNVVNLTASINVSPTISTLFYPQWVSRPLPFCSSS